MPHHGSSQGEARAPSQRQLRVGELIRHALADILSRGELTDDEVTRMMITVPEVRVSPDLRNATAYVMPLGGGDQERLLGALRRAAPWFRGRVSEKEGLRTAPEIRFAIDRTFDEADKIGALLRRPDVARDIKDDD